MVDKKPLEILKQSLVFLRVEELKHICENLSINDKGKKGAIIARILHYIETGEIILEPKFPEISKARKGGVYPLHPDTLILKGSYKNDLKTRIFFKKLVGEYFHFTAFGIDWINDLWLQGNPPTYKEFADMWVVEYDKRKNLGTTPKVEWAYINFIQQYIKDYPNAPRAAITKAWEVERQKHLKIVSETIFRLK